MEPVEAIEHSFKGALNKAKSSLLKGKGIKGQVIEAGKSHLIKLYGTDMSLEEAVEFLSGLFEVKLQKLDKAKARASGTNLKNNFKEDTRVGWFFFVERLEGLMPSKTVSIDDFKKLAEDLKYLKETHPERVTGIVERIEDQLIEGAWGNQNLQDQVYDLFKEL